MPPNPVAVPSRTGGEGFPSSEAGVRWTSLRGKGAVFRKNDSLYAYWFPYSHGRAMCGNGMNVKLCINMQTFAQINRTF